MINPEAIALVADMIEARVTGFAAGLEERLASGMTKALDIVTADFNDRLQALEEDQARILRHLGLEE